MTVKLSSIVLTDLRMKFNETIKKGRSLSLIITLAWQEMLEGFKTFENQSCYSLKLT